jgi:CubicO group peptidase (beta-lactamase class C family)
MATTPIPSLPPGTPDATASDPRALAWMQGAPPPRAQQVRFSDDPMFAFPQLRWYLSNIRQMMPTTNVWRGPGPTSVLAHALRDDLDAVTFVPIGQRRPMTWAQSLDANYTDGIVVLHRGHIVYERYAGVLAAHVPHLTCSVTKSFTGTLAASFAAEGLLDVAAPVIEYVPELAQSGWGTATVRQVMDMTTALVYSEDYTKPDAEVWQHLRAGGFLARGAGYAGPDSYYDFLATVRPAGAHGRAYAYKTVNTDVLGWIVRRLSGKSLGETLSERIWAPMGAEQDAYLTVDAEGTEFAGGGLCCVLRDLARFGETMRGGGWFNGRQIIPEAAVADILAGGLASDFAQGGYPLLPGWSYRNMWWISHNAHGAYTARGIHGQAIWVDPVAEMVIARFASHPRAANANLDPTSLPAYDALARHLMGER